MGNMVIDTAPIVNEALRSVIEEAEKYMSLSEQSFIIGGFDIMNNSNLPGIGLDEAHLVHSLSTALELARLGFAAEQLAAVQLYYPLMTGISTIDKIAAKLGSSIASIADVMLRIGTRFESYLPWTQVDCGFAKQDPATLAAERAKNRSRFRDDTISLGPIAFIAIAALPEIAVARIIDRLLLLRHSMSLVGNAPITAQLARDSMSIHAVVAESLGIWKIKWQIEDAALKILDPTAYQRIVDYLEVSRADRENTVAQAANALEHWLQEKGIVARVSGRPKHIYSIYRKTTAVGSELDRVNDKLGLRVLVDTTGDCYAALDALFAKWHPIQGIYENDMNYRDWIAQPKPNGYQSLHTTVLCSGEPIEVQIRTVAMHEMAEYGAGGSFYIQETRGVGSFSSGTRGLSQSYG